MCQNYDSRDLWPNPPGQAAAASAAGAAWDGATRAPDITFPSCPVSATATIVPGSTGQSGRT
jgi:hypothetical protein